MSSARAKGGADRPPTGDAGTFSIVARDEESGALGIGVASRFLAVGVVVPWARSRVGAIATQALADTSYGPRGLNLLEKGLAAQAVVDELTHSDPERSQRQVGVVDGEGRVASHTGESCFPWAGHRVGDGYACQGNLLAGESVVREMERAFVGSAGPLALRLLASLEAGEIAGGDRRGRQSAALIVVRESGGYGGFDDRYVDLRADDHPDPLAELRRLYNLWEATFLGASHVRFSEAFRAQGDEEGRQREVGRALEFMRRAVERRPDDAEVHNALAWTLAEKRIHLDEAWEMAQRARRLDPMASHILDTVAEVQFQRGDVEGAVATAREAMDLDPESKYLQEQLQKFESARGGGL